MFQNILIEAPPGASEHNNFCNYSNQIWCERSPLCVTHRSSSREHQLRQGDNQGEHGRYVDNVNKSQIPTEIISIYWDISHMQKKGPSAKSKADSNSMEFLALLLVYLRKTSAFTMMLLLHKHQVIFTFLPLMQYNEEEISLIHVRTTALRINRKDLLYLILDIIQITPSWYLYQLYIVNKT